MNMTNRHLQSCFALYCIILVLIIILFPVSPDAKVSNNLDTAMDITEDDDRLSISIQDMDITSVLKALSVKKKLNIVASQDIKGKISVNVHNLPLKDILDAIIRLNGFSYVQKDNIIFVTKPTGDTGGSVLGNEVMVFKMRYVEMDEVEKVIGKLLSQTAKITVYKPEKTLIVEDVPQNLDRVKSVLKALDVPPLQVLIETKIMEVRLNDDTALGIDWNAAFSGDFSGNAVSQGFAGRSETTSQGFFFDVVNGDFNLFLDALQTKTEVNALSSPRLLALDNKEAKIIVGDKLGYNVTTTVDNTVLQSVEFLDAGTQLILTPHIVDENRVIMEIHPEISDGIITNGLPTKTTTEVTTSLMAPNGGTIFIGGLIRDRKEDIKSRVPVLGSIPILGALFGKTTNITVRSEIIVLITPHIISASDMEYLEKDTPKVDSVKERLEKERSVKELLP